VRARRQEGDRRSVGGDASDRPRVDSAVAAAVPQLHRGSSNPVNASESQIKDGSVRRRVRNGALGLATLALAFYFGFIVLLIHHSHH
jgi:hypothetical protein